MGRRVKVVEVGVGIIVDVADVVRIKIDAGIDIEEAGIVVDVTGADIDMVGVSIVIVRASIVMVGMGIVVVRVGTRKKIRLAQISPTELR